VAVHPIPADATAARPSIRLEQLPIAILKTHKGHVPAKSSGGPRSVVAVSEYPAISDATAARPSIRLEQLPIAILKTHKGHVPAKSSGGPRSVVAVHPMPVDATAARPYAIIWLRPYPGLGRLHLRE